jgi:hypothetical protein
MAVGGVGRGICAWALLMHYIFDMRGTCTYILLMCQRAFIFRHKLQLILESTVQTVIISSRT